MEYSLIAEVKIKLSANLCEVADISELQLSGGKVVDDLLSISNLKPAQESARKNMISGEICPITRRALPLIG
jgi:hypothetical protein